MTRTAGGEERRTRVGSVVVRSLRHRPRGSRGVADGLVVVLPGLGLVGYTLPTAAAVAAEGVECAVLDVPGFGSAQPRTAEPELFSIASVAAEWVLRTAPDRPVVVLGHSTGAQAALWTALTLQSHRRALALVMAGPTFCPEHRRLPRLLAATPFAYRSDSPAEIDLREVARARLDLVRLIRSGLRDTPERNVRELAAPLTVVAGVHDAYAPRAWLAQLTGAAGRSARVRTAVLGGSHNNLYTHPAEVAGTALLALDDARDWA